MANKKIISLEISDTLREALRIAAFQENKTISALIRDVLLEKYAKQCAEVEAKQEEIK